MSGQNNYNISLTKPRSLPFLALGNTVRAKHICGVLFLLTCRQQARNIIFYSAFSHDKPGDANSFAFSLLAIFSPLHNAR